MNVNPAMDWGGGQKRGGDLTIVKIFLSNSLGSETNVKQKCQKQYSNYNTIQNK